jgi:hypothetical protein
VDKRDDRKKHSLDEDGPADPPFYYPLDNRQRAQGAEACLGPWSQPMNTTYRPTPPGFRDGMDRGGGVKQEAARTGVAGKGGSSLDEVATVSTAGWAGRGERDGNASPRRRWRRPDPGQQALLVLAHLGNGDTRDRLAGGFNISATTVWRYIREAVDLLAAAAPTLEQAMHRIGRPGVDRKTVKKYVAPAVAAGLAPGGAPMGQADWAKLVKAGSRSWWTLGCGR